MRARSLTLLSVFLLAAGLAGCTRYDNGYYGGYGYGYDGRYGADIGYGYPGPYYGFHAYRYSYGYPYITHRDRHFDGHRHRQFRSHRAGQHDHDGRARSDDDRQRDSTAPRRERDGGRERGNGRGGMLHGSVRADRPDAAPPPIRVERRAPERHVGDGKPGERRGIATRQVAEPVGPGGDAVARRAPTVRRGLRMDGQGVSPSWPGGGRIWQSDK